MKRLKAKLSPSSIRSLKAQLESYKRSLPQKCDELCKRLAEIGVDTAVKTVPVETGYLSESIGFVRRGNSDYLVVAEAGYAAFVEFGTGVVGSGTYKGELPKNWEYDARWSPWAHDEEDPTIWYYLGDDGRYHATRGQTASGFMAASAEAMRQEVVRIAKEVFARD